MGNCIHEPKNSVTDQSFPVSKNQQIYVQKSCALTEKVNFDFEDSKAQLSRLNLDRLKSKHERKGSHYSECESLISADRSGRSQDFLKSVLSQHFMFCLSNQEQMRTLLEDAQYATVQQGQTVYQEEDEPLHAFIIEQGSCKLTWRSRKISTLVKGAMFGESSVVYHCDREMTVTSLDECGLWMLQAETVLRVTQAIMQSEHDTVHSVLNETSFFSCLNMHQIEALVHRSVLLSLKKDQVLAHENNPAYAIYVIIEGTIKASKKGKTTNMVFKRGDILGEQSLYHKSILKSTLIVDSDQCKCIAIGSKVVEEVFGDKINVVQWSLAHSIYFRDMKAQSISDLVRCATFKSYDAMDVVCPKKCHCGGIYIVLDQELMIQGHSLQKGQIYGEQFINNRNQTAEDDLVIVSKGHLALIEFHAVDKFLVQGFTPQLSPKKKQNHEFHKVEKVVQAPNLDSLRVFKTLGRGEFGVVYLVKTMIPDAPYYALKCINKNKISKMGMEKYLNQEEKVLRHLDHPFIMRFISNYSDMTYIYQLTEYIQGADLFDLLDGKLPLDEDQARFYISQVVLCLEYLHSNKIIYRDTKPENIMVRETGYIKLIDMGTAKFLNKQSTFTMVGTPHYMAPEIVEGKGYNFSVDVWSMGVCLFELLTGSVPFGENASDPYVIYKDIQKNKMEFQQIKSKDARSLILSLLQKNPKQRLTIANIKDHKFFTAQKGYWDSISKQQIKPLFAPQAIQLLTSQVSKDGQSVKNMLKKDFWDNTYDSNVSSPKAEQQF